MECAKCQVTSILGYQRGDLCHTDYLPVYLGEEAVYLDAMGMIVTTPVLDQVDCKTIFTPIFQSVDGRLIQANPQAVEVKMAISKPEDLGFHEAPQDHIDTESLLYTKAEFEVYSEYMHASRARKAITSAMMRKYCASTSSCGSYQPSEPGTFNLENLVTDIGKELDLETMAVNLPADWRPVCLHPGSYRLDNKIQLKTHSSLVSEKSRVRMENSLAAKLQSVESSKRLSATERPCTCYSGRPQNKINRNDGNISAV